MSRRTQQPRRRIGRPPAGWRAGEKVKDYPQLSIRLPVEIKAKLHAMSTVSGKPQWRLISDAIENYVKELPQPHQHMVQELLERPRRAGRSRPH